jgi:hypothetical protein
MLYVYDNAFFALGLYICKVKATSVIIMCTRPANCNPFLTNCDCASTSAYFSEFKVTKNKVAPNIWPL